MSSVILLSFNMSIVILNSVVLFRVILHIALQILVSLQNVLAPKILFIDVISQFRLQAPRGQGKGSFTMILVWTALANSSMLVMDFPRNLLYAFSLRTFSSWVLQHGLMLSKCYNLLFKKIQNKLVCLFLANLSSLVKCLRVWAGDYLRVWGLKGLTWVGFGSFGYVMFGLLYVRIG